MTEELCIMPECPYCPACEFGYIYHSTDWEDSDTEWNCLLTEEEYKKWKREKNE